MTNPTVTVLMTNYNSDGFIDKSVVSVLSQTFRDFEFLIVDDCSTDGSYRYLKGLQDRRLSLHQNSQNFGQSKSLNIGLKLARAPLVARMDADDMAFPTWLEELVNLMQTNPKHAVISCQAAVFNAKEQLQKIYYAPLTQEEIIIRSLTESPINHVGSIMRKDVMLSLGGYVEEYKIAADYGLWGKLLRNGHLMMSSPKILVGIRAHSQSLSQLERRKCDTIEIRDVMKKNIDHFVSCPTSEEDVRLVSSLFFDERSLTIEQFQQAINIFDRICRHMKPSSGVTSALAAVWFRQEAKVAFFKRIYVEIQQGNYRAVRQFAVLGLKRFGWSSPFLGFYLLSLGGNCILSLASKGYGQILRLKTLLRLRRLKLV